MVYAIQISFIGESEEIIREIPYGEKAQFIREAVVFYMKSMGIVEIENIKKEIGVFRK